MSLEELITRQNQLLEQQLTLMQSAKNEKLVEDHDFVAPEKIIAKVDPGTAEIFRSFQSEMKDTLGHWITQKMLKEKYDDLKERSLMHTTFYE